MQQLRLTGEQELKDNSVHCYVCPMVDYGLANHIILNSLLKIQAENLMSEKPNKQGPVISKYSVQQTNVTGCRRNQTETEKQRSVLKRSINLQLQTILRD